MYLLDKILSADDLLKALNELTEEEKDDLIKQLLKDLGLKEEDL